MKWYKKLSDYKLIIDDVSLKLHLVNINPDDIINPGDICYGEYDIIMRYVERIPMNNILFNDILENIYDERYKWVSIYEPFHPRVTVNKNTCYENTGISRIVLSNDTSLGLPKFNKRNLKRLLK